MRPLCCGLAIALASAACGSDPTELVRIEGSVEVVPTTCDQFCDTRGYGCADQCTTYDSYGGPGLGAGEAGYLTPGDDQIYLRSFASCQDEIPVQDAHGRPVHQLTCCCEIPAQVRMSSAVDVPVSCSVACANAGWQCNPDTYWPFPGIDGEFLSDASASLVIRKLGNSTGLNQFDCDHVPPLDDGGFPLTEHWCGCR